ncbi:hypothetical protein C8Q75DRAFT_734988 [Abortiporus biennis]|nr:hypothetical protein C8Q75DRAFT_734988 [Abortiporus biennis]
MRFSTAVTVVAVAAASLPNVSAHPISGIEARSEGSILALREVEEPMARGFFADAKSAWKAGKQLYNTVKGRKRSDDSELVARNDHIEELLTRDVNDLTLRDLDELEARGFFADAKSAWKAGKQLYNTVKGHKRSEDSQFVARDEVSSDLIARDDHSLTLRDIEELEARGFFADAKSAWKAGKQLYNTVKGHKRSEDSELVARDEFFETLLARDGLPLTMRDIEELEARGFFADAKSAWKAGKQLYNTVKGHKRSEDSQFVARSEPSDLLTRDVSDLTMRELEELNARGFFADAKSAWKAGKQLYNTVKGHKRSEDSELVARDVLFIRDVNNLSFREFEELQARGFFADAKSAWKAGKQLYNTVKGHKRSEDSQFVARSDTSSDLLTRDVSDLTLRELEELDARGFFADAKSAWKAGKQLYNTVKGHKRDLEDLEARFVKFPSTYSHGPATLHFRRNNLNELD